MKRLNRLVRKWLRYFRKKSAYLKDRFAYKIKNSACQNKSRILEFQQENNRKELLSKIKRINYGFKRLGYEKKRLNYRKKILKYEKRVLVCQNQRLILSFLKKKLPFICRISDYEKRKSVLSLKYKLLKQERLFLSQEYHQVAREYVRKRYNRKKSQIFLKKTNKLMLATALALIAVVGYAWYLGTKSLLNVLINGASFDLSLKALNIKTIILILFIALMVDAIKVVVESLTPYKKRGFQSEHSQVSVIIPLYNKEKEIGKVLNSVTRFFPKENIFVVNDGSTDNSLNAAKNAAPDVKFFSNKNQGKVRAIESALKHIITPFVLLLDADVMLPEDFHCPTSLLNRSITAVAFNVMPEYNPKEQKSLILEFQSHEYAKSMQIGRKFQNRVDSVHCISGATGLFKTKRLKEATKRHSKNWPGEDLERTLIELASDGKVIFVDQIVKTEAPQNLWQLIKQRITGWWPGLWRNIPLFFKISTRKKMPLQLRAEMAYQIFSLLIDPLKLISLGIILINGNWPILTILFLFYLGLEIFTYSRMKNGYLKRHFLVITTYFFYNLFQIILRLGGLMIYIWNRLIKRNWKGVMIGFSILAMVLLPLNAGTNGTKNNGVISAAYQKILDNNGRTIDNCNIYFGYKGFYLDINTAEQAPRYLIVGKYLKYKDFIFVPEMRIKDYDKTLKLTVERPFFKPIVGRISASYSFTKEINSFPILQIGGDYYWGDYNYTSFDAIKEFGREYAITFILGNHFQLRGGIYIKAGIAINSFLDKGYFIIAGFKQLFIGYSSFQNFDYYEFDRKYLTAGIKIKF